MRGYITLTEKGLQYGSLSYRSCPGRALSGLLQSLTARSPSAIPCHSRSGNRLADYPHPHVSPPDHRDIDMREPAGSFFPFRDLLFVFIGDHSPARQPGLVHCLQQRLQFPRRRFFAPHIPRTLDELFLGNVRGRVLWERIVFQSSGDIIIARPGTVPFLLLDRPRSHRKARPE